MCRPTGDERPGDRPHLFDTLTDSLLFQASAVMSSQELAPAMLDEVRSQGAATGVAEVDSPIGPLDCVVLVETTYLSMRPSVEGDVERLPFPSRAYSP